MEINANILSAIAGKNINANMVSVASALQQYGGRFGLDQPHRLAHYLAQLLHESMGFTNDRELWGPTAAQKKYEGRKDLGNTQPGDGKKFMGRTAGQITGRANYKAFYDWCVKEGLNPPDFVKNPELLNTDPWEGLGFIWYWAVGNPTRKSLNALADVNDIEMVTRRVNGGLNGFADRMQWYTKAALVLLGFDRAGVADFQRWAETKGLQVGAIDGIDGPKTRAALHSALGALVNKHVAPAPVVDEKPVVVEGAEKTVVSRSAGLTAIITPLLAWFGSLFAGLNQTGVFILLGISLAAVVVLFLRGEMIASRAKAIKKAFEEALA